MTRLRRAIAVLAALAIVAVAAACGSSGAPKGAASSSPDGPAVTVMTRNLYLGADLMPIFQANADTLTSVLQSTYQQVVDSEIDARLDSVAHEIATARPDLVALQEATVWSTQPPGATSPTVLYDFVATLLDHLQRVGEHYTVASTADGFSGGLPIEGVGLVTMQDRDVILHRDASPVTVTNPQHGRYDAKLTVKVLGAGIDVLRGWASVDATVDGHSFELVATHLEAYDDPTRDAQQAELLAVTNRSTQPVLVLGDLNSAAGETGSKAYDAMLAAGFGDAWTQARGNETGPTCCRSADLRGGSLTQRIDFVLLRGGLDARTAELVGIDESERTPGGRWPSDHAGVVASLAPPG